MHYSEEKPSCSTFRVTTANFRVSEILGFFFFSQSKLREFAVINIEQIWAATWQNQQTESAPSEDSDQPGHPSSLIRVFAVRMKKAWVLSYKLSAQRRLWSDWAVAQADLSLRWAQTHFVSFDMWHCPLCRGNRSNTTKPSQIFLLWHDMVKAVTVLSMMLISEQSRSLQSTCRLMSRCVALHWLFSCKW